MRKLAVFLCASSLSLIAPGLAAREPTAEDLATKGILIGTLVGATGGTTLYIDGDRHNVGYRGGTFAVALPPGEHELERTFSSSTGPGITGVSLTISNTQPIGRRFAITAGKITNLGALYFLRNDALGGAGNPDGYQVVHIDNEEHVRRYLERYLKDVYAALEDKTIYATEHPFMSDEQLDALRHVIAFGEVRPYNGEPNPRQANRRLMVTSVLGTAGWVTTDSRGLPANFAPLRLDTTERVSDCSVAGSRHACIVFTTWTDRDFERRLLVYRDGRVDDVGALPSNEPYAVQLFGDEGIAFGDYDYKLYARARADQEWQVHERAGVKAAFLGASYLHIDGPDGFFTFYDGNQLVLTFTDAATGTIAPIELPEELESTRRRTIGVVENSLVVGPGPTRSTSNMFRLDANRSWTAIALPEKSCETLAQEAGGLVVGCEGGSYVSGDLGTTWRPRAE